MGIVCPSAPPAKEQGWLGGGCVLSSSLSTCVVTSPLEMSPPSIWQTQCDLSFQIELAGSSRLWRWITQKVLIATNTLPGSSWKERSVWSSCVINKSLAQFLEDMSHVVSFFVRVPIPRNLLVAIGGY